MGLNKKELIASVFNAFNHNCTIEEIQEFSSGHINDTYFIGTSGAHNFVLQRINDEVFHNVPALVNNKVKISKHLASQFPKLTAKEKYRHVLTFLPTRKGAYFYQDAFDNYWNLTYYIKDSISYDTVTDKEIAYEGGKLFGKFISQTSDFDAGQLVEIIPGFHDVPKRLIQFEKARDKACTERLEKAVSQIECVHSLQTEMVILQQLKDEGKIPTRVTHNDTKISNALFDRNNKGLCVIDTDTVMPGIVHNDFGDAIRTICNTAEEDEKDLSLVKFNVKYYEAYLKGFLEELQHSLSDLEIEFLPLGAKTIIFIMGLRFLTDYLAGDVYYKTSYAEHNLDRAKNQFKLIESFEDQYPDILKLSKSILKSKRL
ncbi:MAG: aminoglycoside phosphotransferase family protein [Zunongwangia sp.]|uniref:Phosphotransferase n=2 Tax=Zunongwangia profunda TaxID=398743 RepID=D5BGN8_ZUNPS|nr:aminoglycoside phosphotransferase family protein [Zunongwangia profunda]MAC63944.1 aminoglycoside phosphotransferase family protein [Flavobacteriaceae bacterium]MAO35941.1 aminoglycoside phosphotransferase family protein [Zunongwangia sp.]ADF53219.1 phosphotransferase [Zunongwangia profunda SM-A87]MAS69500.1 aminoglycoside phosphotransferase family protein [Zunongwangia sp.]HCV81133.1 aminoglycoside phosphotransferase family protein [Zunongwangia profunda]|tara:strand:+ start:588 stop:1703 length:1116 start_codon:yes stop_codon:yes gene_type:complete